MIDLSLPESWMLALRWLLLLGPVCLALAIVRVRQLSHSAQIAGLFAFLYGVSMVFVTHSFAVWMGWWRYGWDALMVNALPADIILGGATLFGPGLYFLFPKTRPLMLCLPIILGLHGTIFSSLEPLVFAGPFWFLGVLFVFATAHIPAIYFPKASRRIELPARRSPTTRKISPDVPIHQQSRCSDSTFGVYQSQSTVLGYPFKIQGRYVSPVPRVMTPDRAERELAMRLGGRAAEIIFTGTASTGSGGDTASDLALATDLAIDIEQKYGFGNSLMYGEIDRHHMPDELRGKVEQRLQNAAQRAWEAINVNRPVAERVADALLEYRELDQSTLRNLLSKKEN